MSSSVPLCPGNVNVALAVSNKATEVLVPNEASLISLLFETNPGQVSFTGTDGAAISGTITPVTNDVWFAFRLRPAGRVTGGKTPRILIATTAVPTTVRVIAEED